LVCEFFFRRRNAFPNIVKTRSHSQVD
jgi:hypothetical protein